MFKTVAANTVSQLIGKAIAAGCTFVITLLIASHYGSDGFGEFTKITTFIALFYLVADFGFNAIYIQQSHDEEHDSRWNVLFTLRIIVSSFLVFLSLAILAFLPTRGSGGYMAATKLGIILYSPTIILQAVITTVNALFQKRLRYDLGTIAVSAGSVFSLACVYVSTKLFLPSIAIHAIVVSTTIGTCVTALTSVFLVRAWQPIRIYVDGGKMRKLFIDALPLGLTLLCNVVYFRIDSIILTLYRSTSEVGIYGFAYKVFEFALVIPTFMMNALYPLMVKAHESNNFSKTFSKTAIVFLLLSFVTWSALWFGAPFLGLVKEDFVYSIAALRILSIGIPIFFLTSLTMWSLITIGRQWILFWIYLVSLVINVTANSIFIPQYGFIAASWVTVVSEAIVLLLSLTVLIKKRTV